MITWRLEAPRAQAELALDAYREWRLPDGVACTRFYRTQGGYLVRFAEADFEIPQEGFEVRCHPAPEATAEACEHLFLNHIQPLILGARGELVFHASAVDIGGRAVAFVAPTGRGKSTLAAAFAKAGHAFLCDDGLRVDGENGGFIVRPSHASLRLWDESHSVKTRLRASRELPHCAESRPLACAYFLDGDAPDPVFHRMPSAEALMGWVGHSFILDPRGRDTLAPHFERVSQLAQRVPCFRFAYPRDFARLERVRDAIVAHTLEIA